MRVHELSLNELRDAADLIVAVAAAAEAGVLQGLLEGAATPDVLADRTGLDARAVRIVLPVIAELNLVEAVGDAFALTDAGRRQLADPASGECVAGGLGLWLENLRAWTHLPEAMRTGRPVLELGAAVGSERLARFMAGMAARPLARVRATVQRCLARQPGASRVLDLGGGPGLYAREFLRVGVDQVTLLDLPPTIDHVAVAYGLGDVSGLRLERGDFLTDPLPGGPYDLALLSNVLHMLSPADCLRVIKKTRAVLAPGGVIAIGEMLRGRSARAARFAIVMLLRTAGGDAYTEGEYRGWLEEAGFERIEVEDIDIDTQLVTGEL